MISPIVLLSLLLAWLPFSVSLVKLEIGIITFTLYMLGMLMLVYVTILRVLAQKARFGYSVIDTAIALICITFLISTILSSKPVESGYLTFHGIFMPVISYIVIKGLISHERDYRIAFNFMVAGIIIFCLFVIAEFIKTRMTMRVEVFSRDSITIGTFSVIALSYLLYAKLWKSPTGVTATFVSCMGLLASMARGYLVIFLLSPIIYLMIRKGKGFLFLLIFMSSTLVGTVFLSYNPNLMKAHDWNPQYENSIERLTNVDYWKEGLYGRLLLFQRSFKMFLKAPVFGIGLKPTEGWGAATVHNFHLEWLLYSGVVGYCLFSSLFLIHFYSFSKYAKQDHFCAVNLMVIALILVNALTNGFMHGIMPYATFILIGFNEARLKILREQKMNGLMHSSNYGIPYGGVIINNELVCKE